MATGKVGRLQTRLSPLGRDPRAGGRARLGCAECRERGLEETPGEEERH